MVRTHGLPQLQKLRQGTQQIWSLIHQVSAHGHAQNKTRPNPLFGLRSLLRLIQPRCQISQDLLTEEQAYSPFILQVKLDFSIAILKLVMIKIDGRNGASCQVVDRSRHRTLYDKPLPSQKLRHSPEQNKRAKHVLISATQTRAVNR